jgi:hypothetical protein
MQDLNSAIDELRGLYHQHPLRRDWGDPTRQQMIDSLNKAHSVNKTLVAALDKALVELMQERKWRRWLTAGFCGTWAVLPFFLKWLIPYAIKGMLK